MKRSTSPAQSEYDKFLQNYIANRDIATEETEQPKLTKKVSTAQTYIRPDTVNNWKYPNDLNPNDRDIYEDIFRKFNKHNKFGIGQTWATNEPGAMGAYSFEGDLEKPQSENDYSYFSFPQFNNTKNPYIPAPKTMAHEVVHANDHQIDGLTPKIWKDLNKLRNNTTSDLGFSQSINRLKNKIDSAVFGRAKAYYPDTILNAMNNELNQFNRELPSGTFNGDNNDKYIIPIYNDENIIGYKNSKDIVYKNKKRNWKNGLPEMQKLVNLKTKRKWTNPGRQPTISSIPNYHFKGTFASEIPAFALTNLTNPWKTAEQTGTTQEPIYPLNENEQEFLHSTLGYMGDAYPAKDNKGKDAYPTINRFINERRYSIENTSPWKNAGRPLSLSNPNYEQMQHQPSEASKKKVKTNPSPPHQMAKGGRVNISKLEKLLSQLREMMA